MAEQEPSIALAIQRPETVNGVPNMGEESLALIKAGGISVTFNRRVDDAPTNIPGLYIIRMRNGDLARTAAVGEADLVIVGRDMYEEYPGDPRAIVLKPLGFSRCTLKLAVEEGFDFTQPKDLAGLTIATSYINVTGAFFEKEGVNVKIRHYQGGEEGVVKRGDAQACLLISNTGDSLTLNGLKPVYNVLESEAMLIANPNLSEKRGSEQIVWRALRAIMTGVWQTQYTLLKFNYPDDKEEEIMKQTPARESPTKTPLDEKGWKAAETLMPIGSRDDVETNLLGLGAKDLFYTNVTKMIPNLDDAEVTRMMRAIYGDDWQFSIDLLGDNS